MHPKVHFAKFHSNLWTGGEVISCLKAHPFTVNAFETPTQATLAETVRRRELDLGVADPHNTYAITKANHINTARRN